MTEIGTLVGSYGFPIVACIGLFYFINTTLKQLTSTIKTLTESVDSCTKVTNKLLEMICKGDGIA